MLRNTYEDQHCSIARALEQVGERWTLLIIRDAQLGVTRFDAFLASLGLARNVLTDRLRGLVRHGIFERVPYQQRPLRHEYRLTAKGRELGPVLIAMMHWGDRHLAGQDGPSRIVEHAGCAGQVELRLTCLECGGSINHDQVVTRAADRVT